MRHGLCMSAIQRVNGQDKICNYLWTGYGRRWQVHRFVSRTATLLGFSRSTVSCVYQEWSTSQRTSSQLDTTVGSIGVNMSQHPCWRKVLLMYGHSMYIMWNTCLAMYHVKTYSWIQCKWMWWSFLCVVIFCPLRMCMGSGCLIWIQRLFMLSTKAVQHRGVKYFPS